MRNPEDTELVRTMKLAMRVSRRCVAPYSCRKSRRDYTQPQLLACLALKAATKTNYRGVCELLVLAPALREAIGLESVPHWTTLQKFMARSDVQAIVEAIIAEVLVEVGVNDEPVDVAVDSTGMQNGVASVHYQTRQWESGGTRRKPVKVSVGIVCGALLPAALVVDMGSSADMTQMPALMAQIEANVTPSRLFGDRGYDAEWVHEVCREEWGAESLIPAVVRTADGSIRTKWRAQMRKLPPEYGRRWHVESFFSALKRTTAATLSSRTERTLVAEATMKVLAYTLRR